MSQGQQPTGFGKCNVCKQLQPYTSQVCNICQSRLPWAVQVPPVLPTVPVPPTIPVRPQAPPGFEPSSPWQVVRTVAAVIGGGIVLIGVATFIFLTTAGNSLRNTFGDAGNSPPGNQAIASNAVASNLAVVQNQQVSAECGPLNTVECDWVRGYDKALRIMDFTELRGESDEQYLDRLSRQAFQIRVDLHALPPTPARFTEIFSLTMRAMEEWDRANQTLKKALDTRSRELILQAADLYEATSKDLKDVSERAQAIASAPA